ncbi:hypothetical protein BDB01DRAFT_713602 [Pilobolus umbonatus]|nr:hypothetical protein BDB01DRAFT_713602 [Pilobolus umbonatus]
MDIDGVEFINEVHKEIQNVRNMSEDPSNLEADIFSSFNDTHLKTCKQLAVVDTNFLISNLGYVHTIVTIAEGSKGRLVIILPWIVIKELDKLKVTIRSMYSVVKDQAIKAMLYLQKKLSQKIISLKGQKMNEKHNKSTVVTMVHDIDTLSAEQKSKMEVFLNTIESGDTQYTYIKGITEIRPSQGLKTVVPKKVGESLKDGHRTNKKMEVETHIVHVIYNT